MEYWRFCARSVFGIVLATFFFSVFIFDETFAAGSFEVRGGSIYSGGRMESSSGAQVDYGIISNSTISQNIQSGAGNGNKMTITNTDSSNLGNSSIHRSGVIRDEFFSRYANNLLTNRINIVPGGSVDVSNKYEIITIGANENIRYTNIGNSATITASSNLPSDTTHVIFVNGDATIGSDLKYLDGPYANAFLAPQFLIFATEDISIDCGVTEVNAMLFAKGEVNTCGSSSQLTIRGAVLADKINLQRTSSERIVLPAATIFWSVGQAEKYSRPTTVYIHELAPRK